MNLSFFDLLQLPDFRLAAKFDDKEALNRILFNAGMDVSKGYEIKKCLHRALTTNIPQDCLRVEGYERTDDEHLGSGFASLDAFIAASGDRAMVEELKSLDPRRQSSVFEEDHDVSCDVPADEEVNEEEKEG
jgi:hypothetical protein